MSRTRCSAGREGSGCYGFSDGGEYRRAVAGYKVFEIRLVEKSRVIVVVGGVGGDGGEIELFSLLGRGLFV